MDFLDASKPYPYCPGCSHGLVLDALGAALKRLAPDPRRLAVVTDIGCVGLADPYLMSNTFHGLHGRSITYAEGIKLARPEMTVVVLIGDGGIGIGGNHLLHAARRNIGISVLVFDNFNFGMTGGEHSVTTPHDGKTTTTPGGNAEQPLDICAVAAAAGATFVARATSFDEKLDELLADAIAHPGFAIIDIHELCTAYYMRLNGLKKKELIERAGRTGVLKRETRPEFAAALKAAAAPPAEGVEPIAVDFAHSLKRRFGIVVAGSAGMRVRSSVRALGRAAVRSGLFVSQTDDYPITVMTGHSVSELVFSPEPIDDPRCDPVDALIVLSDDGLRRIGDLPSRLTPDAVLYVAEGVTGRIDSPARREALTAKGSTLARDAVRTFLKGAGIFPFEALA